MADSTDPQQVRQEHADLIQLVAVASQSPEKVPQMDSVLEQAEANGWQALSGAIRKILDGARTLDEVGGDLDDEDQVIVRAILDGIQDPDTLPEPASEGDPEQATSDLATLVLSVAGGDEQAQKSLQATVSHLQSAGGEMAQVGDALNRLASGERDAERLCQDLGTASRRILEAVLEEVKKRESGT